MGAYMTSLFAVFVLLIGAISLCTVQTPKKFPKLPLIVGKES